jgi:hypothetical protein
MGLLGALSAEPTLFEPFRNTPSLARRTRRLDTPGSLGSAVAHGSVRDRAAGARAVIRLLPEQWAAFEEAALQGYLRRAKLHVRRAYPELVFGVAPEQVDRMLRGLVDEARTFGLTREDTVDRFIAYRCELGERFHEAPPWAWIGAILRDGARSEREKVDDIDRHLYGGPILPPERR